MKLALATAALLGGTFIGAAHAADLIIEQPGIVEAAYDESHDWTGGYIGIHGGYGWASATGTDSTGAFFEEAAGDTFSTSAAGYLLGIQAGYNWQMDAFVFGIEADLGGGNITGSNYVAADPPDNFAELGISGYADLTARLGFAIDNLLIYAKGGVAAANVYSRFGDLDGGVIDPTDNGLAQSYRVGWTLGAGLEYAFDENWSVKAEYQYFDLGSHTLTDTGGDTASVRVNNHVAKVGLNFGF